jgi:hypothetical protein
MRALDVVQGIFTKLASKVTVRGRSDFACGECERCERPARRSSVGSGRNCGTGIGAQRGQTHGTRIGI